MKHATVVPTRRWHNSVVHCPRYCNCGMGKYLARLIENLPEPGTPRDLGVRLAAQFCEDAMTRRLRHFQQIE